MKRWIPIALIALVVLLGISGVGTYNSLVKLDQGVRSQWGQVQNVYQRRADLVPNLVATVKGAAAFEKDTYTAVAAARAQVGQAAASATQTPTKPETKKQNQQTQDKQTTTQTQQQVGAE